MPQLSRIHDHSSEKYSTLVGAVYIFNLIVGTGALTIPAAFGRAGWLTGVMVMVMLAFMSYVTATYTIEAMAAANGVIHWRKVRAALVSSRGGTVRNQGLPELNTTADLEENEEDFGEHAHLLDSTDMNGALIITTTDFYCIQEKVEMGQMATMFFNRFGLVCFYIIICVYLYGDLAIYGAAMSKTMRDVTCTYFNSDEMCNATYIGDVQCWPGIPISRNNAFRLYVAMFLLVLGPFAFFNVQKTKALQIVTSILRWIAFGTMVVLAILHIIRGKSVGQPPMASLVGLPNLIGVCIYSFMCHHSLPSLITPISNKNHIYRTLAADYLSILAFYLLVALTGVFGFLTLHDLYTLNFEPDPCGARSGDLPTNSAVIQYFLSLFPVFTLSTNFPIIAITLRNNFKQLAAVIRPQLQPKLVSQIVFPLLAVIPPMSVALVTENLQVLVGFTGAFAGLGVQYIVPIMLLITSKRACQSTLGEGIKNQYGSPFRHRIWIAFTAVWTLACFIFILTNYVINGV